MTPIRIAILAYRGCLGAEVFAVADMLRLAGHVAASLGPPPPARLEVTVVGAAAASVRLAGELTLGVTRPAGRYDYLVVPGPEVGRHDQAPLTPGHLQKEVAFIGSCFGTGSAVASVCLGAFLLAEAGLLDGRRATTSWLFADQLARRFPAVRVDAAQVLIDDGAVITSGAVSAAFDLALHLIRLTLGAAVAAATARIALLEPQRASQLPYQDSSLMAHATPPFARHVAQWLGARLREPYDLARLAQAFHVSPRTLLRRIKAETGASPLALLQQARIDRARTLLQTSQHSLARIVAEVGYSDVASFTRLFLAHVGETPARYRRHQGAIPGV